MLRITIEGTTYPDFDDGRMPVSEGIVLEKVTGLTPPKLWAGVNDFSPAAIKALVWLARRRVEGNDCPRYSTFEFDLGSFEMVEINDAGQVVTRDKKTLEITALDGEPVASEPPDPTQTEGTSDDE